jgi:flagellar basal body L-ring protein FlgH
MEFKGLNKINFIVTLLIIILLSSFSDSLWNDKAGGIYNKKVNYNVGDSIQVVLNESSNLEYNSNSRASKSYKVQISGSKISGITDILPQGNIEEDKNSQDIDRIKLNGTLQARVTAVGDNFITIQGIKDIGINNKASRVLITGNAYLQDIKGNSIESNKLIDSSLQITTLIDNNNTIISDKDLINKNKDLTGDVKEDISISDQKKRELQLQILNKILNVILK